MQKSSLARAKIVVLTCTVLKAGPKLTKIMYIFWTDLLTEVNYFFAEAVKQLLLVKGNKACGCRERGSGATGDQFAEETGGRRCQSKSWLPECSCSSSLASGD